MSSEWRPWITAPRFIPVSGALIGTAGAVVYFLSTQIWPTSIAVILSMLTSTLLSARFNPQVSDLPAVGLVFAILVKYNALMALSASSLPWVLPTNLVLGLIMIAGHASSSALLVSVFAAPHHPPTPSVSHTDLSIALALGFAPAALIGIPGLIGLVAAIVMRIAFIACIVRRRGSVNTADFTMTQQLTEACFYLGALATWAYI